MEHEKESITRGEVLSNLSENKEGVGVFVGSYLPYSETFIYDQLKNHVRYNPSVYAYSLDGESNRFPFSTVISLEGLERIHYRVSGRAKRFDRNLEQHRPALIHAHFGTNGVYATPFARRHRLPLIVSFHGHDVPGLIGRNRFRPRYARYAAFSADMLQEAQLLLPASQDLADKLIQKVGVSPKKIHVLRLGINLDTFRASDDNRYEHPTVLMVGRFVEKKGHLYGLRIFARALKEIPEARLIVAGAGKLKKDYLKEVATLGIGHAVSFPGPLRHEEVIALMSRSHVFLCPSLTAQNGDVESGVIVIKEAGACRLPTIGTRHGGIPEILEDEVTGFITEERDVDKSTSLLIKLLKDPKLRKKMGDAARSHIEKNYDIRNQMNELELLYDRFC